MNQEPASPDELPAEPDSGPGRARLVERLFQEHNDSLLRFLSARMGSHQEAKEIAQEAYVRLLSLDAPGAVSYLRAFLFKTASNIAIDRLRTRRSSERFASFEFFGSSAQAASAERQVSGMEDLALLQRLLDELPTNYRRALLLNRVQGLDIAAIAADLHTTERSVRRYIMQALLHCRAGLDAAHGSGGTAPKEGS
jgi:RNA polymerase sigma factor (sigma-70 family)